MRIHGRVVTTARDTHGRPTVVDLVRDLGVRVVPVGRLDADTTGDLIAVGGTVEISGHIAGDAEIRAGEIILRPGATIDGNRTDATKADDFAGPAGGKIGGKGARLGLEKHETRPRGRVSR